METYNKRPVRTYKVVYEHLESREQFVIYIESTSSYEAGESVLDVLGDEFDLIKAISCKPTELN